MKRLSLLICLAFCTLGNAAEITDSISTQKKEKEEITKDGWNFGPLPCISYNSDLGFQYGVCADIFNYKGVFPDYRQRIYLEASRYTKGQTLVHAQFDSKYLIPNIRTTFSASYMHDPMFLFYGFNGVEAYDKELASNRDTRTSRYVYKRDMIRVLADFQGHITKNISWIGGLSYWYFAIDDINNKNYDAKNTLYYQMRQANVFDKNEVKGGQRMEIRGGLLYDTRDNEAAPDRGIWAELYLNGSPSISNDGYNYLKLVAHWRQYVTIARNRLVFAYHLGYQGTIAGMAPFYMQQNISTLYLRQTGTDGLGGSNTVRGLLAQRLVGSDYAWTNIELRLRLFSFNLLNQSWYVATNPFFDAGMVTRLYKGKELSYFYTLQGTPRTVEDLRRDAVVPHCSAGIGLKLAMNRNFIISFEDAVPFKKTDGENTVYVTLNYIF